MSKSTRSRTGGQQSGSSNTSGGGGSGGSPLGRPNYIGLANRCRTELWNHPSGCKLKWWQSQFWAWGDGCYKPIEEAEVRAVVLVWLARRRPDHAKPYVAKGVTECLKALGLVEGTRTQPTWIGRGGPPPEHHLIAMANGLLDVDRRLKGRGKPLRDHSPRWFSSAAVGYPFDPKARCPRWLAFLGRCQEGDAERIALLQEYYGYCLTTDTGQQKALFFEGEGANGKTVAAEVLRHLVGPGNCSHVPLEIFGQRFQLTMTLAKLVNISGDTGELDKVAEGFIKQFTGGDAMYFDRKFLPGIEAKATARLLVIFNNRPRFSDRSGGLWRRMILMPWRVIIPPDEQDKRLVMGDAPDWPFRAELPGIFNWAIQGLRRLRKQGSFTIPKICEDALAGYRLESNPARTFLVERCLADPNGSTLVSDMYSQYSYWSISYGYRPLAEVQFGKEIRRCFPVVRKGRRTIAGKRTMVYEGLVVGGGASQVSP